MALHTKIREYRENRGMKQAELAELVGVRRETIVNLEKGRYNPSLKLAMDIFLTRQWKRCFVTQTTSRERSADERQKQQRQHKTEEHGAETAEECALRNIA